MSDSTAGYRLRDAYPDLVKPQAQTHDEDTNKSIKTAPATESMHQVQTPSKPVEGAAVTKPPVVQHSTAPPVKESPADRVELADEEEKKSHPKTVSPQQ